MNKNSKDTDIDNEVDEKPMPKKPAIDDDTAQIDIYIDNVASFFKRRAEKKLANSQKSEIVQKPQESLPQNFQLLVPEKQDVTKSSTALESFNSKEINKTSKVSDIFEDLLKSLDNSIGKLKNDITDLSGLSEKDEKIEAYLQTLINNLSGLEQSYSEIKDAKDSKSVLALNKDMLARILVVKELVEKNKSLNPQETNSIFESLVFSMHDYFEEIKKTYGSLNTYIKDVEGLSDNELDSIQKSIETISTELSTYSSNVQSVSKELETLSQTTETTQDTIEKTSSIINNSQVSTVNKVDDLLYRQQTHLQDFVNLKISSIVSELSETSFGLRSYTKELNDKTKKDILKAIAGINVGGNGLNIPETPDKLKEDAKKPPKESKPVDKPASETTKIGESAAKNSTKAIESAEKSAAKATSGAFVDKIGTGTLLTAASLGVGAYDMYNIMSDDKLSRTEKTDKAVGTTVGTVGGLGGSAAGAVVGQMLIPIPVVGAVVGGAIGGMGGNIVGEKAGEFTSKQLGLGKATEYVNEHAYDSIDAVTSLWGGDDASKQREIEKRSVIDLFNKKMKTNEPVSDFLLKKMNEYKIPFKKEEVEYHNSHLVQSQDSSQAIAVIKPANVVQSPAKESIPTTTSATIQKVPEPVTVAPISPALNAAIKPVENKAVATELKAGISTVDTSKSLNDSKITDSNKKIDTLSSGLQVANSLVDNLNKKLKEVPDSFTVHKPETVADKHQLASFEAVQKPSQKTQNVTVSLKDLKQPNAFGDTPLSLLSAGYDPSAIVLKEAYQPEVEEEEDDSDEIDSKLAKNLNTSSKKTNKNATDDPDTRLILDSIDLIGKSVDESTTAFLNSQEDVERNLIEKLADMFSPATSQVTSSVNSMWNNIKNVTENMWSTTKTTAPEATKKIESAAKVASNTPAALTAGDNVSTVVNKAKDMVNATVSKNPEMSGTGNKISKVIESGAGFNIVQRADGTKEKQVGSRNWRNNNPGNIEYGEFAKRYGAIDTDGRFAIFPSYEAGREAKAALFFEGKNYKDKTLSEAIMRYAPPSENDSERYKQIVLDSVGGKDKKMSEYTKQERAAILSAMEKHEGFKAGKVGKVDDAGNVGKLENAVDPRASKSVSTSSDFSIQKTPDVQSNSTSSTPQTSNSTAAGGGSSPTVAANTSNSGKPVPMGKPPDITKTPDMTNKSGETGVSNAVSSDGVKVQSGVNVEGLQPAVKKNLYAMATEYKQLTGKPLTIISAYRSIEKQKELYDKLGPKKAAKPGRSMHNFGYAVDIATNDANKLQELGLLDKYNFARPLLNGKGKVKPEPWHVEPKGIQGEYAAIRAGADLNEKIEGTSSTEGSTGTALTPSESAFASSEKSKTPETASDKAGVTTPVANSVGTSPQAVNSEIKSEISKDAKDSKTDSVQGNTQLPTATSSIDNSVNANTTTNNSIVNNVSKCSTLDVNASGIENVSVIPNAPVNKDQVMASNIVQSGAESAQMAANSAVTMINNHGGGSTVNNVSAAPSSPQLDYFNQKDSMQQAMENLSIYTFMMGSSNRG